MTAIFPDLELEEVLEFASEDTGYSCIEVMCWPKGKAERRYAGITHIDVTDFTKNRADEVLARFSEYGINISGLGYYPNFLAPDRKMAGTFIDHFKKLIRAASLMNVPVVNTFIGRDRTRNVEENWPGFLEVWKDIIGTAEEHDVKVGIENCPMIFTWDEWPGGKNLGHSPRLWERMFEAIPSDHFGLNYDPSHMIWQHMDYLAPLRQFSGKLFHIHAKDVRIDRHKLDQMGIMTPPNFWHTPKLPGLGEVDWGKFFSVLSDTGYDGPVCVEVEDRAYEGSLQRRQESLLQAERFLRQFV